MKYSILLAILVMSLHACTGGEKVKTIIVKERVIELHCLICKKDITNDKNKISPSKDCFYYCLPCYERQLKMCRDIQSQAQNSDNISTSGTDDVCSKCDGLGVVTTYSYDGCHDVSHFAVSDCGSDHHTSDCTSSGEKTCPCCHGTGKSH